MDMDIPTIVEEDVATPSTDIATPERKDTRRNKENDPAPRKEKAGSGISGSALGHQRPPIRELRVQKAKYGMTIKFVGGKDSEGMARSPLPSPRASVPPPPALPAKRMSRKSSSTIILKRTRSPSTTSVGSKKRVRFSIPVKDTNDSEVEVDQLPLDLPPPSPPTTSSTPSPPDSPVGEGSVDLVQPQRPPSDQEQQPSSDPMSSSTDFRDAPPPPTPSTGHYFQREAKGDFTSLVPAQWGTYLNKEFLLRNPVSRSVLNLFRCQHCPRKFTFKCYLHAHYRKEHKPRGRRGGFECQECAETYGTFGELMEHRETAHNYDSQVERDNCTIM